MLFTLSAPGCLCRTEDYRDLPLADHDAIYDPAHRRIVAFGESIGGFLYDSNDFIGPQTFAFFRYVPIFKNNPK